MKPTATQLDPSLAAEHESLFARFEQEWTVDDPGLIERVLPDAADGHRWLILVELIRIDMELRKSTGQEFALSDYLQRFPELEGNEEALTALAFEQTRLREQPIAPQVTPQIGPQSVTGRHPISWHSQPADKQFPVVPSRFLGFELVGILGSGAFGRVYLARQDDLARRFVALKVTTRPSNEPECLALLQHTNVVPIFSVHRIGELQAVCMPFMGIATLADLIDSHRESSERSSRSDALVSTVVARLMSTQVEHHSRRVNESILEAARAGSKQMRFAALLNRTDNESSAWLMKQLADGLGAAHRMRIIHGDLKPANILISDDGQPMLLDFHLAHRHEFGNEVQVAGGTLPYVSPEHLRALFVGGSIDPRSDIYSLGAVFYHLLSGRTPYQLQTGDVEAVVAGMEQDRMQRPPRLRAVAPTVDVDLASIVDKCLSPDPAHRYQDASSLHHDLSRHLDSLPLLHAPNRSLSQRLRKWGRRHPRLASAGVMSAALVAVVAIGLGLLVSQWRQWRTLKAIQDSQQWIHDIQTARMPLMALDDSQTEAGKTEQALIELLERDPRSQSQTLNWLRGESVSRTNEIAAEGYYWLANYRLDQALISPRGASRENWVTAAEIANERARKSLPDDRSPRALLLQAASVAEAKGDAQAVEAFNAQAAQIRSDSAGNEVLLATQLLERQSPDDLAEAVRLLRQVVASTPNDFSAWMTLGNALAKQGAISDAIACYSVCAALDSSTDLPYFNRGLAEIERGNYESAAIDFSKAIERGQDHLASYANRGVAQLKLGAFDRAEADLTRAIDLGSSHTRLYFLRSRARSEQGDQAGAAHDFEKFLSLEPDDPDSWVQRGIANYERKNIEAALSDLQTAIELEPRSIEALQTKASLYSESLGQIEPALELMDRLVQYYPLNPTVRVTRGVLAARLQKRSEAVADAESAIALTPSSADTLYRAAGVFALLARDDSKMADLAFQRLAESILIDPSIARRYLERDPDLEGLKSDPRFAALRDSINTLESLSGLLKDDGE